MLLDDTHKKWLIASLVILAAATLVYVPYALRSPQGAKGGSALGLTFGSIGFSFMLFAGLLGARKKVPVWRVGRAQAWMRGHLWLGLLSLPLILFHGGFHFGGALTTVLMWLLIIVVVSGVFGAVLQHFVPRAMTREVPLETIFEEITSVRAQLLAEADRIVESVCGALELTASANGLSNGKSSEKAGGATAIIEQAATAPVAVIAVTEEEREPLRSFYAREMRPFLGASGARNHSLADRAQAGGTFAGLRTLVPPALHETLKDLEDICEEERQLTRQARLHHLLHDWLLIHVPLSLALLALGAVHAVMALRF